MADDALDIAVIGTPEAFQALEQDWNELLEASQGTVFQSFEWASTWWKYFGRDQALHCLSFRRAGRLLGIAPLCRQEPRVLGVPVLVRLRFLGHRLADYGDLIIRQGHEDEVVRAFVRYLGQEHGPWDVCDLEDLSESSELLRRLPGLLDSEAMVLSEYQGSVCPQRSLPPTWEEFSASLGPNLRRNLKRKQARLEEEFETSFEVFRDASAGLDEALDSFSAIHGDRFRSLGFPSAFDDPHHRAFHLELARRLAGRGWLRLSFIKVDGLRVAVSFDFWYRGRIYVYLCHAAGPEAVMKHSPGMLIKAAVIRAGISEGMAVYDLLRGEEAYKLSEWKCVGRKNVLLRLVNQRLRRSMRFRLFLAWELAGKSLARGKWEFHEYRRFVITQAPSLGGRVRFVLAQLARVLGLGGRYLRRNLASPAAHVEGGNRDDQAAGGKPGGEG